MGCDIHAVVEYRRRREDNWWVVGAQVSLFRDYRMFSLMVDDHSRDYHDIGGVAPARGNPPDGAVDYARVMQEDDDWPDVGEHTLSWLTPAEYLEALQRHGDPDGDYLALAIYLDGLAEHYGEDGVRLVFGFDN